MAAAFFGGYASAAPAPLSPEVLDLEPVKIQSTTILPIQIVEVYKATSWALADLEQTLLAGRYTSSKENSLGTFYLAENYAFANKYRRNQYAFAAWRILATKKWRIQAQALCAGPRPANDRS